MKSRPVLITLAVLAGLDVITTSSALTELISAKLALTIILLTKAVQAGMAFYTQSLVTPMRDTIAYVNSDGRSVAGPAAGVTTGQPVDVVPVPPNTARGVL